MQIGHFRLSTEERQRWRVEGACFYCGQPGHQVNQCGSRLKLRSPPLKDSQRAGHCTSSFKNFLFVPVKLCHAPEIIELQALIDSGAEQSLIDHSIVSRPVSLPTAKLQAPVKAAGLGGQHLSLITHCTEPVLLVTSGNHRELTRFFVTHTPQNLVVLGFSWLQRHNPMTLTDWSKFLPR